MVKWVKVPYVFTYKAQHFFCNESLLDGSKKSVQL